MIDFHTFERVKLGDVAEFGRAKAGHIYPRGTSTFQISATKGQVGYLDRPGTVEVKDAVIIPQAGINPEYFNIVLQKNVAQFMQRYATGLNVQESELANFPIDIHGKETQDAVVDIMRQAEDAIEQAQEETDANKKLKKVLLQKMMV